MQYNKRRFAPLREHQTITKNDYFRITDHNSCTDLHTHSLPRAARREFPRYSQRNKRAEGTGCAALFSALAENSVLLQARLHAQAKESPKRREARRLEGFTVLVLPYKAEVPHQQRHRCNCTAGGKEQHCKTEVAVMQADKHRHYSQNKQSYIKQKLCALA